MKSKKQKLALLAGALVAVSLPASAVVTVAFEFNTPGNDQSWQHNGAINGGSSNTTGPTSVSVAVTGEGVLTAQQLPGNGDLRVLYNPDLSLDTGLYNSWTTIDIRFRQLDGLNGSPQELAGTLGNMHLGVLSGAGGSPASVNGSAFVRESADVGDTEFWYTASLDISSVGTAAITQIRIDPIASSALDYQLDYVRVSAALIPEPSSALLLALSGFALMTRRKR